MEPDDEFNTKGGGCEDMNTAQVIPFQKPTQPKQEAGKSMYSDKFVQGYVMSSRLYRKEVWPFLSDAARNVYAELENRINGHNKESDFVSYSQLQGGDLEGSRQLSRETVRNGIKELLNLGVITATATGKRGMKSYRLNDISLTNQFGNRTSSVIEPVHKSNQNQFGNRTNTGSETELTIDNKNLLDIKKRTSSVDNSETEIFSDSVEYHGDNKNLYSLRELAGVYTIQTDLADQAKRINPKLDDSKILSELKNFAQWSTSREKTTAQGWMNYWIYRIQKLSTTKAKASKPKSKGLSDAQVNYFVSELCNYQSFKSKHSHIGESQKAFETRISSNIRKPEYADTYGPYLHELGFVVDLGASL